MCLEDAGRAGKISTSMLNRVVLDNSPGSWECRPQRQCLWYFRWTWYSTGNWNIVAFFFTIGKGVGAQNGRKEHNTPIFEQSFAHRPPVISITYLCPCGFFFFLQKKVFTFSKFLGRLPSRAVEFSLYRLQQTEQMGLWCLHLSQPISNAVKWFLCFGKETETQPATERMTGTFRPVENRRGENH